MGTNIKQKDSFWYRNSLSLVFLGLFIVALAGQLFTGWKEYNEELKDEQAQQITFAAYFHTGHVISATFENFQSEFLQMALYVVLTVGLRQKGSSESKSLDEQEEVDRQPVTHKDAPWPVKKGGIWLWLYSRSLSIVFFGLFFASWGLHLYGSWMDYNTEQQLKGLPIEEIGSYLTASRFWFETFQNWQSEFLSVLSIVVLSIYLRQHGSPESKPVDAPYAETGK